MFATAARAALRAARRPATRPSPASTATAPILLPPQQRAAPRGVASSRLLSSLAVLEQRDGKLNVASLAAVTAARRLGGSVTGFVAGGPGIRAVAEEGLAESYAPMLVENIKNGGYTHVMTGHSAFGKNLLPRVAALLDVQQISDIIGIESEDTFVRTIYAGNAITTVQSSDNIKVITVRGTAFQSGAAEGGSAELVEGVDPKAENMTEWVSEDLTKSDRPELSTAERVVSGGRGLKSKEDFDRLIPPLADALGAAIGASRAAVDSGFADNSLQVGQTGKNVAPQLYLCAGISGAIQHLAGMKDSKVIAAINKDPDAPIFQVADVGLVGDLFEKVPELTQKLKG
ncbi:hypothetical protein BDY21DRAFT_364964 [Lineolata rhizophorae]|uniref:Probable electron transfer flavoprotein subunit alpha n=1 Tax=Lineolata rhizophorae TaxID=578093 RepID=A0A6A6NWZ4_9PEZI|nr:hypothetical protein BDY21DRAFT_364964 [Lineolata rhizophorae]